MCCSEIDEGSHVSGCYELRKNDLKRGIKRISHLQQIHTMFFFLLMLLSMRNSAIAVQVCDPIS